MAKFLVLYLAPASVIEAWKRTEPTQRQEAEDKMRGEWVAWMRDHAAIITETVACGATKRIDGSGITNVRNDVMLYSIVEADSPDAVAQAFASHPHLGIPQATIEVMDIRPMGGG